MCRMCACVHKRLAHAALNRLQAADLSAHELGDLLSEIRQADLKLQEIRLAQRAECRKGDTLDLVERYGKYLQQFGYDLELALISLERFTAEAGAPPLPAAVAPAATPAAANTSSAGCGTDGKIAPPTRSHSTRSMTRSITRSITRSGLRSEPMPREALPQGSRFRRAAHTGPVNSMSITRRTNHTRESEYASCCHCLRRPAHGLHGPHILRWLSGFAPRRGQTAQHSRVSGFYGVLLTTYLVIVSITSILDTLWHTGPRRTCELHRFACTQAHAYLHTTTSACK